MSMDLSGKGGDFECGCGYHNRLEDMQPGIAYLSGCLHVFFMFCKSEVHGAYGRAVWNWESVPAEVWVE